MNCIADSEGDPCTSTTHCYSGFAAAGADSAICINSSCTCPVVKGSQYVWKMVNLKGRSVGACVHPGE